MTREEARSKAREIVSKMTIEEKASQLRYDAPAVERLGIPAYNWWNEGIHGVARAGTATLFPQAIGLAATFDEDLLKEIGNVTATEARAKYNAFSGEGDRTIYKGLTFWAPNVNIFRDPRWGRGHETYGEDPFLTSRLGVSFVEGMQGDPEGDGPTAGRTMKVAACAKHFAVHSGPEALRHGFDAKVSQKDLRETYLPAFKALVTEAKVEAVMGAYNRVNGEVCCGSKTLIEDILRGEWKFEGHYVSDCWAIRDFHEHHKVTANAEESAALAIGHGCDVNCGNTYLHLLRAYQEGLVSEEQITTAAERLFTTRYLLGIMPDQHSEFDSIPYTETASVKHIRLSEHAAEEGVVLLKNDGVLPVDICKTGTIGIIGPNADSRDSLTGNYHGTASHYVTVAEGIRKFAAINNVRVLYSAGSEIYEKKSEALAEDYDRLSEAEAVCRNSDVIVLALGLNESLEGEEMDTGNHVGSGDKTDLMLPESQRRLMETVAEAAGNKPVILVLMAGSDIDLGYAGEHFGAILDAWYPGEQGGTAIAKILFGEVSPSGKLPVTFYNSLDELPEFTDYSMEGRTYRFMKHHAQYPFGFGLTYGDIRVETVAAGFDAMSKQVTMDIGVRNRADRGTADVVEIYVKALEAPDDERLNWSLCGIKRVELEAGESGKIQVIIDERALESVNDAGEFSIESHCFRFYVGTSQPDEVSVMLSGKKPVELEINIS